MCTSIDDRLTVAIVENERLKDGAPFGVYAYGLNS